MKLKVIALALVATMLGGCSAVPTVELKQDEFVSLRTVKLASVPHDDNSMLHVISNVDIESLGVGFTASSGDEMGLREFTLYFMDKNSISFNQLVQSQFLQKISKDNLAVSFTNDSPNRLVLTINVVVLGMKHGLSDEFNALFNISGQLFNADDDLIWSYNSIPIPPAPGYSSTIGDMFYSPESFNQYLVAASEPIVHKLYEHFKKELL
ncbi:hypothetical protein [Photobacterium satsumensis]|uniref:hypothetical protein n=1 Tax=Photobacterium satsumensis TaxID=2910239 RepID=UPI003D0C1FBA